MSTLLLCHGRNGFSLFSASGSTYLKSLLTLRNIQFQWKSELKFEEITVVCSLDIPEAVLKNYVVHRRDSSEMFRRD
jgi:hypothetical protein